MAGESEPGARRANTASKGGKVERLLADLNRVADAETHLVVEDFIRAKRAHTERRTVEDNARVLITILA